MQQLLARDADMSSKHPNAQQWTPHDLRCDTGRVLQSRDAHLKRERERERFGVKSKVCSQVGSVRADTCGSAKVGFAVDRGPMGY